MLYRQLNIFLSVEVRIRGVAIIFLVVNEFVQALIVPTVTDAQGHETNCRFSLDSLLGLWSAQVRGREGRGGEGRGQCRRGICATVRQYELDNPVAFRLL